MSYHPILLAVVVIQYIERQKLFSVGSCFFIINVVNFDFNFDFIPAIN